MTEFGIHLCHPSSIAFPYAHTRRKRQNLERHEIIYFQCRCPSLSCPPGQVAPGGQANHGQVAPGGNLFRDILPPPWISSPRGDNISRLVYLAPGGEDKPAGYLAPTYDSGVVTVQKF